MPEPIPAFLAMHHFQAPPRITAVQPGENDTEAQGGVPATTTEETEDKLDLLEVRSCGSFDQKSQTDTDADDFKDLSPEKTSEKAKGQFLEKLNFSPEGKEMEAMQPLEDTAKITSAVEPDIEKVGSAFAPEVSLKRDSDRETKQGLDKLEDVSLPEAAGKQAIPALMLSRVPGPGWKDEVKQEVTPEILAAVKSEVSSQFAALQAEMAGLKASLGSLVQEFQNFKDRQADAKPAQPAPFEELNELKGAVKRELHDVQEVLNSELKDLTSHFKGELQELSDKVQALEAVDTQLSQTITAVTLDSAALQSAFEETRPAVANLAAAQSALGSAQRETEKQLNASILRQKSDALALNARVKEIESGWTGLFGCYCKRRRPREAAFRPSELSASQLDPQQIPADAERQSGSIDAD